MEFRVLRYFLNVSDFLHIAQPPILRLLKELEENSAG